MQQRRSKIGVVTGYGTRINLARGILGAKRVHISHCRQLIAVLASALLLVMFLAPTGWAAVTTQLAFILDGSESITDQDWSRIRDALAAAVEDAECLLHDGSVEVTVVQFSAFARVEVGPVIVTEQNASQLAATIRAIPQMAASTCISCGLCLAADTLQASPNFDPQNKQILNLFTDGDPNVCSCSGDACAYEGTNCYFVNIGRADAVCARDLALGKLAMTPDQDHLDAEFLGALGEASAWLRDSIVWPQPGTYAPPFHAPGWVAVVDTTDALTSIFCTKCMVASQPATLTVVNEVHGQAPSSSWVFTGPRGEFTIPPEGGTHIISSLPPDGYPVSMAKKDGYICTIDGIPSTRKTITLQPAESRTITFVNTQELPELVIEKILNDPVPIVGSSVQFTVTVANQGSGSASQVQVTDTLPDGYTYISHTATQGTYSNTTGLWFVGPLPTSTAVSLEITATVLAVGEYTNVAYVDWAENTGDPLTASASATPVHVPSITLTKSVSQSASVVGTPVMFTVTVANQGSGSASQVQVTDTLPDGYTYISHTATQGTYSNTTGLWFVGPLPTSTAVSLEITATVLAVGEYTNVAYVDWAENTGDPLTASASATPVSGPPPSGPPSGSGSGGNLTPIADAGKDQIVCVGERVTLDASSSFDPDGISGAERIAVDYTGRPRVFSDLSFEWSFSTYYYQDGQPVLCFPVGSVVTDTAEGFNSSLVTFVPDLPGDYVLAVIVSDATGAWSTDQVTIHAVTCTESHACWYPAGLNLISLPAQPIDPSASAVLDSANADLQPVGYQDGFTTVDTLSPLEGAWVRFAESATVSTVGREIQDDVSLWLDEPGWHLISSPFLIDWDSVMVRIGGTLRFVHESVARSHIDGVIICYDPIDREYRISPSIDPCHGYWIRTYRPDVKLVLRWGQRSLSSSPWCGCVGTQVLNAAPAPPPIALWEASEDVTAEPYPVLVYPNPASSSATISLFMPDGAIDCKVWIYDLAGHVVLQRAMGPTEAVLEWDLRSDDGEPVANGIYLCLVTARDLNNKTLLSNVFRLLVMR